MCASHPTCEARQLIPIRCHRVSCPYFDTRGRKRGVWGIPKPVLFTILDIGFREDLFSASQ